MTFKIIIICFTFYIIAIAPTPRVKEYKLRGVDGSIIKLQNTHGFRNYVKTKAVGLKLTGWIKRVPRCDVEIVVSRDERDRGEVFVSNY